MTSQGHNSIWIVKTYNALLEVLNICRISQCLLKIPLSDLFIAAFDTNSAMSWKLYWRWHGQLVFSSKAVKFIVLFVSLLSHFWLIHLFYLHLLYQPYVGLCQATRVQSHQRQSTSAVAIATCEVQVSAADYQTVSTVATGVSKPLCCRLTLTFTLTSENLSLYITLLL